MLVKSLLDEHDPTHWHDYVLGGFIYFTFVSMKLIIEWLTASFSECQVII